jgi:OOP family OmpA-OmpF porin
MKLKLGGQFVIAAAVAGLAMWWINHEGYFDKKKEIASSVPPSINLPRSGADQTPSSPVSSAPTVSTVSLSPADNNCTITIALIPWQANDGALYANGGQATAAGSLMAKRGVKVVFKRIDDYSQMLSEAAVFAKDVKDGNPCPSRGIAFHIIMGDGYPVYQSGSTESLGKFGAKLQVIAGLGYSRGEDKCMMNAEVRKNPQLARGKLIAGVKGDGDNNVCFQWARDNSIPVNPDPKTYDPDAINFVYTKDFVEAGTFLINGFKDRRKNVKTGKIEEVKVTGAATWTPGDVDVWEACNKNPKTNCYGISSVASTSEYIWQMPATLIGLQPWMDQNKELVKNMLAAFFEGGELVRTNDNALTKASEVAAKVFGDHPADWWKTYFKGQRVQDVAGNSVLLGGSTTNGLGDQAFLFGLNGQDDLYRRIYEGFGKMHMKFYPDLISNLTTYDDVVNKTFVEALLKQGTNVAQAAVPNFQTAKTSGTFAKRDYYIQFDTGKATFSKQARETLDDLLNNISTTGLVVQVNGHTDNVGNSASNLKLSVARANAVKEWLVANSPAFPADRIRVRGYGDTDPKADNHTKQGQAENRRVEIVLLNTQQ